MATKFSGNGERQAFPTAASLRKRGRRHGISTIWILLFVPVFLVLFVILLNAANLWLARV